MGPLFIIYSPHTYFQAPRTYRYFWCAPPWPLSGATVISGTWARPPRMQFVSDGMWLDTVRVVSGQGLRLSREWVSPAITSQISAEDDTNRLAFFCQLTSPVNAQKKATRSKYCPHQMLICIVTTLQRLRRKDHKCDASLAYTVNYCMKRKKERKPGKWEKRTLGCVRTCIEHTT